MRCIYLIGATTLLATGCAETDAFLPTVKFDKLDIRAISFEEIQTEFVFDVSNPNPIEIELANFSYALDLQSVALFSGDNADGFTLGNRTDTQLVLPVDVVFSDVWDTVQATQGEDVVAFGLQGHFGFDTPIGDMKLPYHETGDFPALRTPKFRIKKLRLKNLTVWDADLEIELAVANEHQSTLFFDDFDYALQLGGKNVASGLVQTFDVAGDAEGTVKLPINVDLLTAGVTLVDAILGQGNLDVGLAAGVDVDTPFGVIPLSIDETGKIDITE